MFLELLSLKQLVIDLEFLSDYLKNFYFWVDSQPLLLLFFPLILPYFLSSPKFCFFLYVVPITVKICSID